MIDLIFYFGTEMIFVRIVGTNVTFAHGDNPNLHSPIDGMQLNYAGVCREFPDLELREDWREEAIKRFKDNLKTFNNEDEIADYIVSDLKNYGYVPKWKQRNGFRRETL